MKFPTPPQACRAFSAVFPPYTTFALLWFGSPSRISRVQSEVPPRSNNGFSLVPPIPPLSLSPIHEDRTFTAFPHQLEGARVSVSPIQGVPLPTTEGSFVWWAKESLPPLRAPSFFSWRFLYYFLSVPPQESSGQFLVKNTLVIILST